MRAVAAWVSSKITKLQKRRRDHSLFAALIAAPGDLDAGIDLPAQAWLYVATDEAVLVTTVLVECNGVAYGIPVSDEDLPHPIGFFGKNATITKEASAPGIVSLYVRGPAGNLVKIGESA